MEAMVGRWISEARAVLALTGAGISAESGVPTFRGDGGYWRSLRAEELATPEAFARDPHLVWEWYNERRLGLKQKSPNPGHRVLASWEKRLPGFQLITQNVDGLHRRAGSTRIVRYHGDIWELRCTREETVEEDLRTPLPEIPPRCPRCGALMRPNIVWFGEPIPPAVHRQASRLIRECDLLLVIGTSGVVFPAAGFAYDVKARGARVVEINPDETPISALADAALRGPAGGILPKIDATIPSDH